MPLLMSARIKHQVSLEDCNPPLSLRAIREVREDAVQRDRYLVRKLHSGKPEVLTQLRAKDHGWVVGAHTGLGAQLRGNPTWPEGSEKASPPSDA